MELPTATTDVLDLAKSTEPSLRGMSWAVINVLGPSLEYRTSILGQGQREEQSVTKYIKHLRTLPMPLRVAALTSLGVFLIAFISLVLSSGQRPVVAFSLGLLGVDGIVLGTILATDYRGYASAYAGIWTVAEARPWLRIYIRVYGAVSVVGGAVFVAVSVLIAFARTS